MQIRRLIAIAFLTAAALGAVGCGSSKDKGKNQDNDRPKPVVDKPLDPAK